MKINDLLKNGPVILIAKAFDSQSFVSGSFWTLWSQATDNSFEMITHFLMVIWPRWYYMMNHWLCITGTGQYLEYLEPGLKIKRAFVILKVISARLCKLGSLRFYHTSARTTWYSTLTVVNSDQPLAWTAVKNTNKKETFHWQVNVIFVYRNSHEHLFIHQNGNWKSNELWRAGRCWISTFYTTTNSHIEQ